jgi:hypothetical protein
MVRDFGSGMSIDELIGISAWDIRSIALPNDTMFDPIKKAVTIIVDHGFESYMLAELWGDGHSVWQQSETDQVIVVTPTGQLICSRD